MLKASQRRAKSKLKANEDPELWRCRVGTRAPSIPKGKGRSHKGTRAPSLPKGKRKAKGSGHSRNRGRGTGCLSPPFLFTEEVGTPKASLNWGKITLNYMVTLVFAQTVYFDDFFAKYFFIFRDSLFLQCYGMFSTLPIYSL